MSEDLPKITSVVDLTWKCEESETFLQEQALSDRHDFTTYSKLTSNIIIADVDHMDWILWGRDLDVSWTTEHAIHEA